MIFALIWLPTNEATLFQFRGTVNNVHRRYSGQKAWCLRIQALYLYVIVFSLNCKISDKLPEIDGAQVDYTLKDINAGRNSSRDTAQKAKMKAKANSVIKCSLPYIKGNINLQVFHQCAWRQNFFPPLICPSEHKVLSMFIQ